MKTTIKDVINRIEDWKGKKVNHKEIGGGITNHNYIVTVQDEANGKFQKYVVRIPGEKTDIFIDRENELECSVEAGKTGVAPKVIYSLKPENVTVIQFIEGKTLNIEDIVNDNQIIAKIVSAIKTIHEKAKFKSIFNPFETIRRYMNYVKQYDAPLPYDIDWMIGISDRIEEAVNKNKIPMVACHNDYLSENFIYDGKRIWIIDWEYGGQGDPYFDLADFAVEHPFNIEQEKIIIREYCGNNDDEKYARMYLYKIISDLWWGIWAMIQSKISTIDFDYFSYGNDRFERMRANIKDPRFEKSLSLL